ncbi:hypothetical protein VaNZ11_008597 [Volvox africanus]|uniref:RING-type E3 ubiquitin transferase n=1 Tax=Volvox africanus TaxID=51714 RepID=A0ABQ5S646_9CHLO|nr:hypothetical protein VaNZ11_008597 [Volvox africanus]
MSRFNGSIFQQEKPFRGKCPCMRNILKAQRHYGSIYAFLVLVFVIPAHGTCLDARSETIYGNMTFSNAMCGYWTLSQSDINNRDSCPLESGGVYLLFEFWRLENNSTAPRSPGTVHFLVARGRQPKVSRIGDKLSFNPEQANPLDGQNGTWRDAVGVANGRPHQRILVPINASTNNGLDWYVTVANLGNSSSSYGFRVNCIVVNSSKPAPCPRPGPNQEPCGGSTRGTCVSPPQGVARPELNQVCNCTLPWGDVDCQTLAPSLSNGTVTSTILAPDQWAYWQFTVPMPSSNGENTPDTEPVVLVEMSRGGGGIAANGTMGTGAAGPSSGGDPILLVMPKMANESYRVPYINDILSYGDVTSARLQQNFHFMILRDLQYYTALYSSADNVTRTLSFYVAVYNYGNSSRLPVGLRNQMANVTLRVRWRTIGTSPDPLCPNECYGRGNCSDPSLLYAIDSQPWPPGANFPPTKDFDCKCQQGYGGPMCEGTIKNLIISTSGDKASGPLMPGQWAFSVVTIDPRRFDVNSDILRVEWTVQDSSKADPWAYYNALLTANYEAFPRVPLSGSDEIFTRGLVCSYDKMFTMVVPPKWHPIQIVGLESGASYVLGLYNSDYVREGTYNYTLKVIIPTQGRTWLQPYMSVVLGVSASLILCLLMTLCRRILQRYGWGPFRQRATDAGDPPGGGGNMFAQQGGQTQPRQRGVPANIIDTFHSYEYQATRAEKVQLAKSRPEVQQAAAVTAQGRSNVELSQFRAAGRPAAAAAAAVMARSSNPVGGDSGNSAGEGGSASGVSGNSAGSESSEEPQCAVCLCEYEEGEVITKLPCKHEFHGTCIRKWLQTHYTCPICRISLLPDRHEPEPATEDDDRTARSRTEQLSLPQPQATDQLREQEQQWPPLAASSQQPPSGQQPWAPSPPLANGQQEVTAAAYGATIASASGSGGVDRALGTPIMVPMAAPPPSSTQAEAAAGASRPGLLTRVRDGAWRFSSPRQDVSLEPVEMLQPSIDLPGSPQPYEGCTVMKEPVPAALHCCDDDDGGGGGSGSAATATAASSAPLLSVLSVRSPNPTSLNRFAAGSQSSVSAAVPAAMPEGATDAAQPTQSPQLVSDEPLPLPRSSRRQL